MTDTINVSSTLKWLMGILAGVVIVAVSFGLSELSAHMQRYEDDIIGLQKQVSAIDERVKAVTLRIDDLYSSITEREGRLREALIILLEIKEKVKVLESSVGKASRDQ